MLHKGRFVSPKETNVTRPSRGVSQPTPPALPANLKAEPGPAATREGGAGRSAQGTTPGRLVVGPQIKLKGIEIADCDTLVVEGQGDATIETRVLQIAGEGAYIGAVNAETADVQGTFQGDLVVRDHLVIQSTGRVTGKVRYGRLTVAAGGELSGDVGPLDGHGLATIEAAREREATPSAVKPKVA